MRGRGARDAVAGLRPAPKTSNAAICESGRAHDVSILIIGDVGVGR
jgi:hypothetical protein